MEEGGAHEWLESQGEGRTEKEIKKSYTLIEGAIKTLTTIALGTVPQGKSHKENSKEESKQLWNVYIY